MASRTKRPTQTSGHPNAASGSLSIENEIERSRETERWEKVIEKADQLRQRPDKAAVLADFLVGEAKLEEYMKVLEDSGILEKTSFIIGLGPFASAKSAKWMNDNLYGVDVPEQIIKRLEQAKDQKEESKKICLELIQIFREIKGVKGIHLMGHKKEEVIAEIIKESKIS